MNQYHDFNEQIIKLVGGKANIQAVVHCMTRLRFTLKDRSKADTKKLQELEGVIDVVSNNVAYQIIVGTHVNDVYKDLVDQLGMSGDEADQPKTKKNPIKAMLDVISESMNPILEPIICAGLLAAFLSIISLTGLISTDSSTYQIFDALRSAVFYFLPILMAMSCAKRLGASPYLAVALAATILSEPINNVSGLSLFGIGLPQITYSNSFIPILLAVWFMGYVTKFAKKVIPKSLQYFMSPLVIMLITLPATLLVFGPLGFYIGEGDFMNLWLMVAAVAISFIGATIAAYMLGIPVESDEVPAVKEKEQPVSSEMIRSTALKSVVEGEVVPLNEINDQAFSTGALGKGIGIKPISHVIHSPIDGEVLTVFPTKHAIGLRSDQGVEVLIHIGIDTVSLEGKYFTMNVKQGDRVRTGQPIGEVDFEKVREAGYDPTTIVVITNTNDFLDVIPTSNNQLVKSDDLLNIVLQ